LTPSLTPSLTPPRSPTSASISEFDAASGGDEIHLSLKHGTFNEEEIGELHDAKAPVISTTPATATAIYIGEFLNAKSPATTPAPGDIRELLNVKTSATASVPATASATVTSATDTVPFSPLSTFLNSTGLNIDAPSSLTDLYFLNDPFNDDSQTSTISTSSSWSPGPPSVLPSSSSLSPSSPRKRNNSYTCASPESKMRRLSSELESAPGGSKPNTNKKENDRLIAKNDTKMKQQEKEIADMWTMIKMKDVWLACKWGKEFDSVKSNFSEFLVSQFIYRKIMADEQDAGQKTSELETFRKNKKNRDKRKDVIMFQKDIIKGQEEVLGQLKSLSQDLDIMVKT